MPSEPGSGGRTKPTSGNPIRASAKFARRPVRHTGQAGPVCCYVPNNAWTAWLVVRNRPFAPGYTGE